LPERATECLQVAAMLRHPGWMGCNGEVDLWRGLPAHVNSMMYGEARAIATIASSIGNAHLAANFTLRADYLREVILEQLWSEKLSIFAVYKLNLFNNGNWKCNFSGAVVGDGDEASEHVGNIHGCPPLWPCNQTVEVRELLGLSPPWYFGVVPQSEAGPTKYEAAWAALFDAGDRLCGRVGADDGGARPPMLQHDAGPG
jgi:hypothetical protein